jgi:deoxyribodipyrimidine photo-lyase
MASVNPDRIHTLREGATSAGMIVYWMSRDQRASDNWALLHAQEVALRQQAPLAVAFTLAPEFLGATARAYDFMLTGLAEVEANLRKHNIAFHLLSGHPHEELPRFVEKHNVAAIVTDFSPLRIYADWKSEALKRLRVPVYEVDAHNVVPCRVLSGKREYAAYTIRPKINRLLSRLLTDFPKLKNHTHSPGQTPSPTDWKKIRRKLKFDHSVAAVDWLTPGEIAAHKALRHFLEKKLARYAHDRNDPGLGALSNLSPYLHFGQISAQRVAFEAQRYDRNIESQEAFLEELIVRRELSDNFCFHCPEYDSVEAFPDWARKTLEDHRGDPREYLYELDQLESADTHDPLWNAAQAEMVVTGKMHGYMRMYWAKKILEWSPGPEEALNAAIYLNDRYELDGRDPNGYTGIAWSIGGLHDRPWFERPIFGKVRYMSYDGCRRKFDIERYISTVDRLAGDSDA